MKNTRVTGLLLSILIFTSVTTADAQQDRDLQICGGPSINSNAKLAACNRIVRRGEQVSAETRVVAYNARGFSYHQKEQYDRAIADYTAAISLSKKASATGVVYSNRGNSWYEKGKYDRSIADHDRAIGLLPRNAAVYSNRARTFRAKGDLGRAMADFDQAIKLEPKSPYWYIGRGMVWRIRGELDRAITEYDHALRVDRKNISAHTHRGIAYEGKGDIERARVDYKAAVDLPLNVQMGQKSGSTRINIVVARDQETARVRLRLLSEREATLKPSPSAAPPSEKPAAQTSPAPAKPATVPRANDRGRGVALVIGNGAYKNAGALVNPPNDARAIGAQFRAMGFEVLQGIDLNRADMDRLTREFLLKVATARIAVMFYAGHGMQIEGRNYLVPVDASFAGTTDIATDMAQIDTILAGLDDQIRTNIVFLDACRDNPLAQKTAADSKATRSLTVRSGLATPSGVGKGATVGAGTLIAFATAPGQVALDGDGANSPFSAALARHLSTPGIEVQQMLTRVRAEVVASTHNKQVPWSNSSLLGEVYLAGKP
jgi:tetratricopeptide (TPR) repeat protein